MEFNELAKRCCDSTKKRKLINAMTPDNDFVLKIIEEVMEFRKAKEKHKFTDMRIFEAERLKNTTDAHFKHLYKIFLKDTPDIEIMDTLHTFLTFCNHRNIDIDKLLPIVIKYNELRED